MSHKHIVRMGIIFVVGEVNVYGFKRAIGTVFENSKTRTPARDLV